MRTLLSCLLLIACSSAVQAEVFTTVLDVYSGTGPRASATITVATNQLFRVVNAAAPQGTPLTAQSGALFTWTFTIGAKTFTCNTAAYSESSSTNAQPRYSPQNLPQQLAGPFSLTVESGIGAIVVLTYEIVSTTPSTQIANTVVIPEDSNGPVQIVLEQSTDLISWTAANPGTYGATTQKRFFRLRAVKQ